MPGINTRASLATTQELVVVKHLPAHHWRFCYVTWREHYAGIKKIRADLRPALQ